MPMLKKAFCAILSASLGLYLYVGESVTAQAPVPVDSHIQVAVDLVQLNVAVTDRHGNYVTGLHPSDFSIEEDGIPQKIATFGEGNEPTDRLVDAPSSNVEMKGASDGAGGTGKGRNDSSERLSAGNLSAAVAGANVFVLFDTSNYMYSGFVFAQDAISDFIRSLESASRIAFYSYSRDLSRATRLTSERSQVLRGVRTTVAGDDAALYNCLLLTGEGCGSILGPQSHRGVLQRTGQCKHCSSRGRSGASAIDGNSNLHGMHATGPVGAHLDRGIRAHDSGNRREGLLCQHLEKRTTGICLDKG